MFFSKFSATIKSFARDRKANVAILFAIMSPVVMIALAGAVDYSHGVTTKEEMQAALDAAVLAGAKASLTTTQTASITVAGDFYASNIATVTTTSSASFSFNSDGSLTGTATYPMPTLFSGVTGASTIGISVTSTAKLGSSTSTTASTSNVCVLLLSPNASQSLLANSGTNINGVNCEIDVASTANPAAIFDAGGSIKTQKTCLQGANYINNGGTVTNLAASCTTATNPYVGNLPAPASTTCSGANANGGTFSGTVTLSPGVYCGWFNFNNAPTVTLLPGVYVIKGGGWNVDGGSWTGSGVTFYFADTSNIQYNSGLSMTISAPSTGTYAGILFYELDGLANSPFVFDDSVSESMTGLIYLPSRNITFNSTSNETTPNVTVVANTAIFNNLNWSLTPVSQWPITNSGTGTTTISTPKLTQ